MSIRKWESGAGKVGTIISLLVLVIVVIVVWEWVPKRFDVFALKDDTENIAHQLGLGEIKEEKAVELILLRAKSLELPLTEKGIAITRDNRAFYISLKYEVPLNFIFMKHQSKLNQKVEGTIISV